MDPIAVLVNEHGLAHGKLLDLVGMDGKGLGMSCRTQAGGAKHIDLSGMLDAIFGADRLDDRSDILGVVEPMDQIAVATLEHLPDEVVRSVADRTADVGDALGRQDSMHAGTPALVDQIEDLLAGEDAELIEDRVEGQTLRLRLLKLGASDRLQIVDDELADTPGKGRGTPGAGRQK